MNTASYELIENYLGVAFVKQLREIFAHVPQLLSIQPQTSQPLQPTPSWFASLSAVALAAKISDTGRCLNNQPNCVFRICLTSSALFSASVFALCRLSFRSVLSALCYSASALCSAAPRSLRSARCALSSARSGPCSNMGRSKAPPKQRSGGAPERRSGKRRRMNLVSGNMLCRQQYDGL